MAARVLLKATRSLQRISVSQCLQKRAPVLNVAHRQFSVSSAVNGRMLYSESHEYLDITDGNAKLGITDHAQSELGEVVFVEFPDLGPKEKNDVACTVESVKAVAEIYMPISGEVVAVNSNLESSPDLVNNDPYKDGWLVELKITDESQLDSLMDEAAYKAFLSSTD